MQCIPDGIKRATIIANEFVRNSETPKLDSNSISSPNSAVTAQEVFIAHSRLSWNKDYVPETWRCDVDCSEIGTSIICSGQFQITEKDDQGIPLSKKLCPHFRDSGNI